MRSTIHKTRTATAVTRKMVMTETTKPTWALMKNPRLAPILLIIAGACALFFLSPAVVAAQSRSEQELLDILRSNATLQEKDAACAELKRVGTAVSVPALADLLTSEMLSHTARYALESMPAPEASLALIQALDKTTGLTRAGIIHSLGRRKETRAVSALSKLLGDPDPNVAGAAAKALGRIGGAPAIDYLFVALGDGREAGLRNSVFNALHAAANEELTAGRRDAASTIFVRIHGMPVPEYVRAAAYRGMIVSAAPTRAVELVKTALQGGNGPEQMAALEMARTLNLPGMTRVLCDSLGKATSPLQVALIEALRQRNDPAATPSLMAIAKSPEPAVRVAAIGGLGDLGDETAVPLLLEAAGSADETEARAARQALLVLRRGDVAQALISQLTGVRPSSAVEAARALAGRGDREATASLMDVAAGSSDPLRSAAFLAVGQLANQEDIVGLVKLVAAARDSAAREQARGALGSACLRLKAEGLPVDAAPIVDALAAADSQTRTALLQAGSALADERLRAALRSALADSNPDLREAAARALWETRDAGLMPDLLGLARQSEDLNRRVPAVRGYVRLAEDTESVKLSAPDRVKALAEILPLTRAEERWGVLAGLAKIVDPSALELAVTMLDDPATRGEAAQAVTAIAAGLVSTRREHARMGLERVLAACSDPAQRDAALAVLKQLDPTVGTASPARFRRVKLDGTFRSEGLAVADFNRDGRLDIATGNTLYLGPDWKPLPMLNEAKAYNPEGYSDEFLCFAEDIDRDGWLDLIVVGFPEGKTRWLRNPGRRGGPWQASVAIEKTGNESPDWLDVDRDGRKELVFISVNGMGFARPGKDVTKPWPIRVIARPGDPRPAHGLGVGDVNGDGRADIVCPEGWWESPADRARVLWTFHAAKLGFEAPAQMLVFDVDGDGDADIVSSGAHRYGLWWYEQTAEGWTPHEIDRSISQLHALRSADINGDGLPDLVTGKRFWAHLHNDEGIDDPSVLCWFEMKRENGKPSWVRHDIDFASGVGLHVQVVDLDGDGLLDIATSNKKGVYVFIQEGPGKKPAPLPLSPPATGRAN
jgi:HEAT repeat protein